VFPIPSGCGEATGWGERRPRKDVPGPPNGLRITRNRVRPQAGPARPLPAADKGRELESAPAAEAKPATGVTEAIVG
jgi:hypothetical protein